MVLKEKTPPGSEKTRKRDNQTLKQKKMGRGPKEKINSWHDSLRIDKLNRINDMAGTGQGINRLEKVEAALQESQEFNTILLNNAPSQVVVINPDTSVKYVNPSWEELNGWTKDEIIGQKVPYPWMTEEQRAEPFATSFKENLTSSNGGKGEMPCQKKNGEIYWIALNWTPVKKDGQLQYLLANSIDITDRKRTEEAIHESEERFRRIFQEGPLGIALSGLDFKFHVMNKRFCEMFGYTEKELQSMSFRDISFLEDTKKDTPGLQKLTVGELAIYKTEKRYIKKNREVIWGSLTVSLLRDNAGKPQAFLAMVEDITEHKKMEEQLIRQEQLASVGQLSSGIAHEINNPLTSIITFSNLLLKQELHDDMKEDLEIINSEAQRASKIIKNLLTFARKRPQEKQLLNINESIEKALELRAYEQKVNNILVNVHLDSNLPQLLGNSSQLQQVFFNIIINAEFSMLEAHGKGILTITTEKVGNYVRASIADDGLGISQENMERLFTPFFTTKEVGKGTGLGLSICHGIITEHDGRIWAESELGKGARFFVELPIYKGSTL